ncbi:MAG TPA: hypothetical protein DCG34_04840 [Clostridiales bacterium]|jgi:hypothetical protein|nr:hypothetical protein [Clostridiales bacterium]
MMGKTGWYVGWNRILCCSLKFKTGEDLKNLTHHPVFFGINSQNNPHIYELLIGFRNSRSLSDFEIYFILLLFSNEKFSKVEKDEFDDFLANIIPYLMMENVGKIREELIELSKNNRRKYFAALRMCEFLELFLCKQKMKNANGTDALRNIRKLYCELRRLLNKHIIEPNES